MVFFYICWGKSCFCFHTTDKRPLHSLNILHYLTPLNISCEDQLYLAPVAYAAVEKVVMSVPLNKAPGFDKVPVKVYRDCLSHVLGTKTDLVNLPFECSIFPRAQKKAEVVPLIKSGDYEVPWQ